MSFEYRAVNFDVSLNGERTGQPRRPLRKPAVGLDALGAASPPDRGDHSSHDKEALVF